MASLTVPLVPPAGAGAAVAGTAVGAAVGSGALSPSGMVAGGAGVAVALGSASSALQATAKSMTALNTADRITSDILTGWPPNHQLYELD